RQGEARAATGDLVMKKILALVVFAFGAVLPATAVASSGGVVLDRAPINLHDKLSLQRGAQIFVNHCLNCPVATSTRYARLMDLGLDEAQIRANLMLETDKIGDPMGTALQTRDAKAWFGVAPPDLSLIGRSRGPDWLYTYFRSFYRDPAAKSGWNNTVFPNVG